MKNYTYGAGTHVGCVRSHNEDSYFADSDIGLWLVADGMGGHKAGEVASKIVTDTIVAAIKQGASLTKAVEKAHSAVLTAVAKDNGYQGMGSTVVALTMRANNYEIAWVGDSRAYLWSNGVLNQLTRDHTFVQEFLDAGVIDSEEASKHPQRNRLSQVLGLTEIDEISVGTISGQLQPGERLLLCSDGLSSELDDQQIAAILGKDQQAQKTVDELIQTTLDNQGKDNITVLIIPTLEQSVGTVVKPQTGRLVVLLLLLLCLIAFVGWWWL